MTKLKFWQNSISDKTLKKSRWVRTTLHLSIRWHVLFLQSCYGFLKLQWVLKNIWLPLVNNVNPFFWQDYVDSEGWIYGSTLPQHKPICRKQKISTPDKSTVKFHSKNMLKLLDYLVLNSFFSSDVARGLMSIILLITTEQLSNSTNIYGNTIGESFPFQTCVYRTGS